MKRIRKKITPYIKKYLLRLNFFTGRFSEVVWLIGDGRSGSTWVSNLMLSQQNFRYLFEPFHYKLHPLTNFMEPHYYLRPGSHDYTIKEVVQKIFSVNILSGRVLHGKSQFIYDGLFVKDIFASLLARWAYEQNPDFKIILLLRNPFEVALSKQILTKGHWGKKPIKLLEQKALYEDFLSPFESLILRISQKENYVLDMILLWAILNYIPLKQFKKEELYLMFYEDVLQDPNKEIEDVFSFIKNKPVQVSLSETVVHKPSFTSQKNKKINSSAANNTHWRDKLSNETYQEGRKILEAFGLDKIYNESGKPDKTMAYMLMED